MLLRLLINVSKMRRFREKGWNCHVFSGQPLGNALKGCWTAIWRCQKGIGKPLGNAQRLLESLWAILKEYRKAPGKCPNTSRQPMREEVELPSGCLQKRGNFPWTATFLYINKNQTHLKICKSLSESSPNYFLSHHTTFRQTQTGATVPLKVSAKSAP